VEFIETAIAISMAEALGGCRTPAGSRKDFSLTCAGNCQTQFKEAARK
jgi:hypothetical protein